VQNVAPAENDPSEFHDGLVQVTKADKWGLANSKGRLVVPMKYDGILNNWEKSGWLACSGCQVVHKGEHWWFSGGQWFLLDKQGRVAGEAKEPTNFN
jgi:hypothetical protein